MNHRLSRTAGEGFAKQRQALDRWIPGVGTTAEGY